ncbi:13956_t:CDS:2, partial [Entrophospora sp. SA101]
YTDEEIIERQGEIGLIPYNRGHKLKNRADLIDDKSRLKAPYDIYQDIEYIDTPNNQRCPIIHRFPRNSILKAVEYYDDTEFNPYKDINVGEILGPLVKLEDVIKKPHYKRILNDNSLTHCADFLMERIETEKNFNNIIKLGIFCLPVLLLENIEFPELMEEVVVKALLDFEIVVLMVKHLVEENLKIIADVVVWEQEYEECCNEPCVEG